MVRRYLLAGLLACGLCGRRMESAWSSGRRHTAAGAATPARWRRTRPDRRTPMSAGTSSCRTCPPAPAAHQPRRARPAPYPRRSRCQEHHEPRRGDRAPARARNHHHLGSGRRCLAGARHQDCQDRHRDSTLVRLQSPDQEGRERSERRSPSAGASLRRVTIRHARKRADMGIYCLRDLNPETGAISPDRGNHAISVTGAGYAHPGIPRRVCCSARHLACAWLGARCADLLPHR
jgi:hypothetical protein